MRLSEIMSQMNLDAYPQAALIIFLGVWVLVALRTLGRGRRAELDSASRLPLADDGAWRPGGSR